MAAWGSIFRFRLSGLQIAMAVIAVSSALAGCGGAGGGSKGPPVFPVTGVVKFKGQAVSGADIVFNLKDGSGSSFGRTDSSGKYELTTRKSNDGALPGDYLVTITKADEAAAAQQKFIPQDDPNYNPFAGKNPTPKPASKGGFPEKYGDAKTSGLTARVNAEKNTIDFDLN